MDYEIIDKNAYQLRIDYELFTDKIDLFELCKRMGIKVFFFSDIDFDLKTLPYYSKIENGFSLSIHKNFTIYINDNLPIQTQSFTLGHELKHYIFCDIEETRLCDVYADHFSRVLLAPPVLLLFDYAFSPNIISERFGLSIAASRNALNAITNRMIYMHLNLSSIEKEFLCHYLLRRYKMNNNYENFLLLRPVLDKNVDDYGIPIIKRENFNDIFDKNTLITTITNFKNIDSRDNAILTTFKDDKLLESYWRNPLKYCALFDGFYGVCTPDYSIYPNMSKPQMVYNIFRNRWIGVLWQTFGLRVIPTISWSNQESYQFCFRGVEKHSTVSVSTIGIQKNKVDFLNGFNEMKKQIEPELIIVVGKIIPGMNGNIYQVNYLETYSNYVNSNTNNLDKYYYEGEQ